MLFFTLSEYLFECQYLLSVVFFRKIKTPGGVFQWLDRTVLPYLFPTKGFSNETLSWKEQQFTAGLATIRFGAPRLRQLRTKSGNQNNIFRK